MSPSSGYIEPVQKAVTLAVFGFIVWSLGNGILGLARSAREQNPIVRSVETIGIGFAAFSFAGVVLCLLGVPLHWAVYVAVSAVLWAAARWLRARGAPVESTWDRQETSCAIAFLILLAVFFAVYLWGANAYAYLEDDDPWYHAQAVLYVAKEHRCDVSAVARAANEPFAYYLEPYPPTYDIVMGVMRQLNDSTSWTLKTFNVLMTTLAIAFNFPLGKMYLGSTTRALLATFVLAVLPGYMSHFIYSQTLALCIFPVAMYATMKAMRDRTWTLPAVLSVASMLVTQPVVSFCFGVVLLLFVAAVVVHDPAPEEATFSARRGFVVGAAGFALSLLFWGRQFVKWGIGGIVAAKGKELTVNWQSKAALLRVTFGDVLFPPTLRARIDAPVGWGLVVALALLAGIGYSIAEIVDVRRRVLSERLHLLAWFFPMAYLGFAPALDLPAWGSARMWAYMAVPVAFLATEGLFALADLLLAARPRLRNAALIMAALAIAVTCLPAKTFLETAEWMPGIQWAPAKGGAPPELLGFVEMSATLPRGTRVYSFCGNGRSIGFDMDSSPWVESEAEFRSKSSNVSAQEAIAFLDENRYTHLVFDRTCGRDWGAEHAVALIKGLTESPRVRKVLVREGFVLAELTR
jgi:hypothetical protein